MALKDVSFEVKEGEVLGIVGNNGAGKSTLLKIISRITAPSAGSISGRGKIASLLEVGTGFHPELTGRENIFLNGHILGMRKKDMVAQFDAIVDFSGISDFIDTPVKRYSSGMYTRLAFAVAAHLEPDILVVDDNPTILNDFIGQLEKYYQHKKAPLNSIEGIIRQLMGWREFVQLTYRKIGSIQRTKNFWGFKHPMPKSFYDGTTGIDPIDLKIGRAHV